MTQNFKIRCRGCGGGWIMLDTASKDEPDAVYVFPRLMCLGCGASEDVRSETNRVDPLLYAEQDGTLHARD